jgi:hypothetical protein
MDLDHESLLLQFSFAKGQSNGELSFHEWHFDNILIHGIEGKRRLWHDTGKKRSKYTSTS